MEATIIPLRLSPKHLKSPSRDGHNCNSSTHESSEFDISNIDILVSKDGQLISTKILLDVEPASTICCFLLSISSPSLPLKGKRAVRITPTADTEKSLYCVPLDFPDDTVGEYGFLAITDWFTRASKTHATHCTGLRIKNWLQLKQQTPQAMQLLFCKFADDRFKWSIVNPGFPDENFSFAFDHHHHHHPFSSSSTKSPFSLSSSSSTSSSPSFSSSSSSRIQEACRERVVKLDRCDMVTNNPLFGSNLSFKYKVDRLVTNRAWAHHHHHHHHHHQDNKQDKTITNLSHDFNTFNRLNSNHINFNNDNGNSNNNHNKSNYYDFYSQNNHDGMNTLVGGSFYNRNNNNNNGFDDDDEGGGGGVDDDVELRFNEPSFISDSARRNHKKQTFPLHRQVSLNNVEGVLDCLGKGHSPLERDPYQDTPLHRAAEKGHVEVLRVMLDKTGISINSTNRRQQTLLHIACIHDQPDVMQFVLERDINTALKDNEGRTALQRCGESNECGKLLRRYLQQPLATIDIHLMDCSHRQLVLPSHADTTVEQLHRLMMRELQLPDDCVHVFAIWICSRNLQLQLRKDQKPIQQLNDWKSKIVAQMTDHPPEMEDPELYWRRDVLLSIKLETMVTNHVAIGLLFAEAYHNYIKSFYLCSEHDVVFLAGFIMQLFFGNFKSSVDYFEKDGVLESLVPPHLLPRDGRKSWCKKVLTQYQTYSSRLSKNINTVHQIYFLKTIRQLTTYGCAFFIGYGKYKNKTSQIFVGINDVGCQIIETIPRRLSESFKYSETDWKLVTTSERRKELVLRRRKTKKSEYVIVSKQAGLMDNLMRRLSSL